MARRRVNMRGGKITLRQWPLPRSRAKVDGLRGARAIFLRARRDALRGRCDSIAYRRTADMVNEFRTVFVWRECNGAARSRFAPVDLTSESVALSTTDALHLNDGKAAAQTPDSFDLTGASIARVMPAR